MQNLHHMTQVKGWCHGRTTWCDIGQLHGTVRMSVPCIQATEALWSLNLTDLKIRQEPTNKGCVQTPMPLPMPSKVNESKDLVCSADETAKTERWLSKRSEKNR